LPIDLENAVAIVTGAGSGIGRGAAQAFARRRARVVVTDLDEDRAKLVAGEIGETAIAVPCDVTRVEDLEATRSAAIERFGRVDLIHNNVGVLAVGPVEKIPLEG
jgi:NAD(P)-dependent dehydrogenase (short-subunit alcohol dehydrogenase family)